MPPNLIQKNRIHSGISKQLAKTMRGVPQPVIVVMAGNGSEKRGMTCSSFTSISLSPPIVSFAIKLPSSTRDLLLQSPKYAIHLLSEDQMKQSICYSSPKTQSNIDEFPHYDYENLAILQGSMSVLLCERESNQIIGDHDVWYSRVLDILPDGVKKVSEKSKNTYTKLKPLLYYESSYRSVGDEVFIEAFENTRLDFADWTHRAHLRMAWIYLRDKTIEDPLTAIKEGIAKYNLANASKLKRGYNETITIFFFKMVQQAVMESPDLDFIDFLEKYPDIDNFQSIFSYYSSDLLYSDIAKKM